MSNVDDIMTWEDGDMTPAEEITFFQSLVDSGAAWQLQGMYGRRARDLICDGTVTDTHHALDRATHCGSFDA